jgi:hypothetical protein
MLALLIISVFGSNTALAQFPIKIPKLKVEKPKSEQPKPNDVSSPQAEPSQNQPTRQTGDEVGYMPRPEPDAVTPRFLLDTLEIIAKTEPRYWKAPTQNDNSSWFPQVSFGVFYDSTVTWTYTAEWFNPDGSPWFTERLKMDGRRDAAKIMRVSSPYSSEELNTKAIQTTGTYGLKITNTKTSETVFQGKFKVNKIPLDPKLKNRVRFYVDNDWNLPIGYVGFDYNGTRWDYDPQPMVFMWFKGNLQSKDFEARLYHNNQQIASTDEADGYVNTSQKRGEECYQFPDVCAFNLWEFRWANFKVPSFDRVEHRLSTGYIKDPKAIYTKDKPGEYAVKIFYKGEQVRETKFTVDAAKGWLPPNPYSSQIYLNNLKIPVPVKVSGILDKWNAATWRTDAFYGNPLSGFNVQ